MEACITELPELGHHVGKLARWPARLTQVPPRIQTGALPSVTPESFRQDTELWRKRMSYYKEHLVGVLAEGRYRNVMDMNAGLGGFAANLDQDKTWVMNAVPPRTVSELEEDTLGVVYERGLIGTYQDWLGVLSNCNCVCCSCTYLHVCLVHRSLLWNGWMLASGTCFFGN